MDSFICCIHYACIPAYIYQWNILNRINLWLRFNSCFGSCYVEIAWIVLFRQQYLLTWRRGLHRRFTKITLQRREGLRSPSYILAYNILHNRYIAILYWIIWSLTFHALPRFFLGWYITWIMIHSFVNVTLGTKLCWRPPAIYKRLYLLFFFTWILVMTMNMKPGLDWTV